MPFIFIPHTLSALPCVHPNVTPGSLFAWRDGRPLHDVKDWFGYETARNGAQLVVRNVLPGSQWYHMVFSRLISGESLMMIIFGKVRVQKVSLPYLNIP
jgi:hypothetical protein